MFEPDVLLGFEDEAAIMTRTRDGVDDQRRCRMPLSPSQWRTIARIACALVQARGDSLNADVVDRASFDLGSNDRQALQSLFFEPIKCYPGESTLTSGQHRSSGLCSPALAIFQPRRGSDSCTACSVMIGPRFRFQRSDAGSWPIRA
jgi:hypothetical protein